MTDKEKTGTFRILVDGLVQGVGFRPFIYRLARESGLKGWVENRNDGVIVQLNADREHALAFMKEIRQKAPLASHIESMELDELDFREQEGFSIRASSDMNSRVTGISPDIAVCDDCRADMLTQAHRLGYPFINCTHCGPRFSIIRKLPYDRSNTTMDVFAMCPVCRSEYMDVENRRFHAQPVSCNECGPTYSLNSSGDAVRFETLLEDLAKGIGKGRVYALKGLGGYHLVCDAFNPEAVDRLRKIKKRDAKPFAVMFGSLESASSYTEINEREAGLLDSWQRPIVLLRKKNEFTPGVADGLSSIGVMLPYMPLHHLLFEKLATEAVVLTSGNLSDEPVLISDERARLSFGEITDGVVSYNREIHNRCDDSVAMIEGERTMIIRRSRGYAPLPVSLKQDAEGVFAAGAELLSSFALGKGKRACMSQYIGDLKNMETYEFYRSSYERFRDMFRFTPRVLVHDYHPDYLSSKFARELSEAEGGLPIIPVQHHHAHIASVMADHGLEGEVIGFSYDGLGLGDDGHLWGAEVMTATYSDYFRYCHFEYVPLPGGDKASEEPWRMAVSYLYACYGSGLGNLSLPLSREISQESIETIAHMLEKRVNSPLISSAGRLFDAVAALLGINYRHAYQAEAAMRLEALAEPQVLETYPYELEGNVLSFKAMIRAIAMDVQRKEDPGKISSMFHNTLVEASLGIALKIRKETGNMRVVLSGGSFQNRILTGKLSRRLEDQGFQVFLPVRVPVNDQGIALGQIAIGASKMKELGI